jgi:hypothetical protein
VSAPRLAGLVLPSPGPAWDRAAALVETAIGPGPGGTGAKPAPRLASAVGTAMAEAEGVAADDPVVRWWRDRLPRR